MTKINRTDRLFVTIFHGGANLYSTELSGLSTIGEIYRQVKDKTSLETGMVTMRLRNSTQGWTQQHNLVHTNKNKNTTKANHSSGKADIPAKGDSYPSLFDSFI